MGVDEDEAGVEAKDGRVRELEGRAQEPGEDGRAWVRERKLVEVVEVRDAEEQRRHEDDPAGGDAPDGQMQGDDGGAEDHLLGDGTLTDAVTTWARFRRRRRRRPGRGGPPTAT